MLGVGNVLTYAQENDAEALVRGAHVGSFDACPLRVIPAIGQVSQNGSECSQRRVVAVVSQTVRAGFHIAKGAGTEQSPHVLGYDVLRADDFNSFGEMRPEPGSGPFAHSRAPTGQGYVLAGEPAGEDVHRFDGVPVDLRDVAVIGAVGPVVSEDL